MKKLGLALVIVSALALSACTGLAPLQLVHQSNMQNVDLGSGRMRKGTTCGLTILGFIGPFGKETVVDTALRNHIRRPMLQEYEYHNYILFQRDCMIIYGE